MTRRTFDDEDSHRLPEGFTRVGYDADTQTYFFRDSRGVLHQSNPAEPYGVLSPVTQPRTPQRRATVVDRRMPSLRSHVSRPHPKTFQDILPTDFITSPSSASSSSGITRSMSMTQKSSPSRSNITAGATASSRLVRAVRQTTVPKLQAVVQGVTRRTGSISQRNDNTDEYRRLLGHERSHTDNQPFGSSNSNASLYRSKSSVVKRSYPRA